MNSNFLQQQQNSLKRSQKSQNYYIPKLNKTSNMPKLEIVSNSFDPDQQKRTDSENNDKENKNTANLPTRKANNPKKLNYINSIFKGIDVPNTTKNKYSSKTPTDLRGSQVNPNKPPAVEFRSPKNANLKQKASHRDSSQDKYTFEARFSPIIREINLTIQNNVNRYENYENSMNTTPKGLRPKAEENAQENPNIRRSMSLEDIRLVKKASLAENSQDTSNKSSRYSVQRPEYAFSFNNKAGTFSSQQQQFEMDQIENNEIVSYGKCEEDFIASLGGYIDYFDQSIEAPPSTKNEGRKEREHKESYQTLLRQFRQSNDEISTLKVQLDDIKNKKNELVATNSLIFREINSRRKKEQEMKERMENMEGLILDLKKEVNYYKLRFKEVQIQLQEERDTNKIDLLKLKKILSNNIDLAFGHGNKIHYDIDKTLEKTNPHRNSSKKIPNVYNVDQRDMNTSLDHKSILKYKGTYAKGGVGAMSTVLNQHDLPRRIENKNSMKQLQAPWSSMNNVTPVSTEEVEETSSRREAIRGNHDLMKESEETKETEEIVDDEDEQETDDIVESEARTIQRLYQEGLEKEKQIKNLQKRLGELLLNNETKANTLRLSHGSAMNVINQKSNVNYGIQRYDELQQQNSKKVFNYSSLHRRHASTFVEVPISEDLNEYSFSLPNSE